MASSDISSYCSSLTAAAAFSAVAGSFSFLVSVAAGEEADKKNKQQGACQLRDSSFFYAIHVAHAQALPEPSFFISRLCCLGFFLSLPEEER